MTDPVDPLTVAAHGGVETGAWPAGLAQSPYRPGTPRPSAADVLSGRTDAHTAPTGSDCRCAEWARDLTDRGG